MRILGDTLILLHNKYVAYYDVFSQTIIYGGMKDVKLKLNILFLHT